MRILYWSENSWPQIGGIEVLGVRYLRALQERGHELLVVTRQAFEEQPQESRLHGIPVHRLPIVALGTRSIDAFAQIRQRVVEVKRAFAPDVVHVSGVGKSAILHLHTMRSMPAPTLTTVHRMGPDDLAIPHTLTVALLRRSDWVVTVAASVLAEVRRQMPELLPRSSAILNALDTPRIEPAPLPFDPPRLVCVGRLVHLKGFDLALGAFARVLGRYPAARLAIAGDGDEREALERLAGELGVAASVDFLGWVSPEEVSALMNAATLVVAPSRDEGLPLVGIQASQMGRPLVTTRVAGLPELVVDGETGVLLEPEDGEALASAILSLLERPEEAVRMGAAARRRALDVFGWERHLSAYEALYHTLASQASGTAAAYAEENNRVAEP